MTHTNFARWSKVADDATGHFDLDLRLITFVRSFGISTNGGSAVEAEPHKRMTETGTRPRFWITALTK